MLGHGFLAIHLSTGNEPDDLQSGEMLVTSTGDRVADLP